MQILNQPKPPTGFGERVCMEPYRLLFPLGALLACAGVSPWFLLGTRVIDSYHPIYHAMAQIQGFLTSFAAGFLLTMIPRRTQTSRPALLEVLVVASCPVLTTVAAWFEQWSLSQLAWLTLAAVLLRFLLRRRGQRAGRQAPAAFIWLPLAFVIGIAGSLIAGIGGILGREHWVLHQFGRGLLLQGMFVALVVGVGSLAIPLMTRGESAPPESPRRRLVLRALYLMAATSLVASFWIEAVVSVRWGLALRGAVTLATLLSTARNWRLPTERGVNRWLIWIASWCLPAGFMIGAVFSDVYKAGLHVSFIGGLGLLTLAVGAHVVLGHGGYERLKSGRPWPLVAMGAALLTAVIPRALVDLDPVHFYLWLGLAASLFLSAVVLWLGFVGLKLRGRVLGS